MTMKCFQIRAYRSAERRLPSTPGWLAVWLALVLSACVGAQSKPASLYTRLGGKPVIEAVVAETIDVLAASHDGRRSFDRVNLKRVKRLVAEQFCALSGGPCTYSGDDMRISHAGLHITEREFNAIVQILRDALNRQGVGEREKNELLRLLAPMKRDIVGATPPTSHPDRNRT
jgi:hemoglobin